ncbi:cytochrome P450 97B3 [Pochonia chlamydosporia 170]|uniref:Cytochrome P450 97B3 n=1 Tax=Pochonia chlamydosporia 170 TaxID=1380566 RepID=A0A179F1Y7_METCM|nr:cytochrome P450 97B3 [Pochonia chlamydosporia 170]OAQ59456.1 cytochrome P450 97B3 [Pochonia chlamydosporia 170]
MGPLRLVWRHATLALLTTCALLIVAFNEWPKKRIAEVIAMLWISQFMVWGIWSTFVRPHFTSPLRHLPQGTGSHWLLGHGRKLTSGLPAAPMREWITEMEHDGLIRYFFFFNRERVLVCSPSALKEVLVSKTYDFPKPAALRTILGRTLGSGILLAEGDEHKAQRKNLMPAFHSRHVKTLYPMFWRKAYEVIHAMTAACSRDSAVLEVNSWASRCTLDIIGLASTGIDFGAIQDQNSPLALTYTFLSKPSHQSKTLLVLGMFLPGWILKSLPLKRNKDIDKATQTIRNTCCDLIQEKKRESSGKERTSLDIVSVALESGHFTDEQLVDQVMTFLAAGYGTTASALTWAVYQLSRYPEVQRRLRKEIRERLQPIEVGLDISSVEVDGMSYLKAVCSEVLRTYSPVPQTVREAACDTTIQGQFIPKGTRITLAPWATNVDPRLWGPDAGEFKPERWLLSASGGANGNYAFMTFLHGPRSCIGSVFAKAELACLLAAWVGRFEFNLEDETLMDERNLKFQTAVTAKPLCGMHLRVTVVEGW